MPNLGLPELLIVLVIVLVIFGASRLTDIMGALGKGVAEFRKGTDASQPDPNVKKVAADETPKTPPTA